MAKGKRTVSSSETLANDNKAVKEVARFSIRHKLKSSHLRSTFVRAAYYKIFVHPASRRRLATRRRAEDLPEATDPIGSEAGGAWPWPMRVSVCTLPDASARYSPFRRFPKKPFDDRNKWVIPEPHHTITCVAGYALSEM